MLYEDVVECEGCGATITHLVCGRLNTKDDPNYYLCDDCAGLNDEEIDDEDDAREPDIDDTVHACPNCERPQQFEGLCPICEREADTESQEYQERGEAAAHLRGGWG